MGIGEGDSFASKLNLDFLLIGDCAGEQGTAVNSKGIRFLSAEVIVPGKDGDEGKDDEVNFVNEQLGTSGLLRSSSKSTL